MPATITDTTIFATPAAATTGVFYPNVINRSANAPPRFVTYKYQVTIADQSTTTDLGDAIPANHVLLAAEMNFSTLVVLDTAVKVGLGISGDPDSVLLSGTVMTKNTHTFGSPRTWQNNVAAVTYRITSCDTNGASAAKFNAATTIDVFLHFLVFSVLPDAA